MRDGCAGEVPVIATVIRAPAGGTSDDARVLLRRAGLEPPVVEYLTPPPSPAVLLIHETHL